YGRLIRAELDNSEKTLSETIITILAPCELSLAFDYHNRTIGVRPIATALLQWGYNRDSLARDLWKRITDSQQKIDTLRKLLRPYDASMVLPSPESGFVPRRAWTWQDLRSKFLQSDDLRSSVNMLLLGSEVVHYLCTWSRSSKSNNKSP
ncbi:hypothetical protein V1525DRAFT_399153, partial [Lipomyces kononenkoae]